MRREQQLIASISLFTALPPDEQRLLVQLVDFRSCKRGDNVVREGDTGGGLFAVLSGFLKAASMDPDGREVVHSIMGKGEVFGELSVLDGKPRSATVTAIEDSELATIARAPLVELIEASPKLAVSLLGVLAERVRNLTHRCELLSSADVSSRLAKILISLATTHGEMSGNSVRIRVKLSQQVLADMCGTSRESVNRLMRGFQAKGVLVSEGGRLVIKDLRALNSMIFDALS
jgi:CRP-like cAMP-binding protein